ncbi:hypothetical protein DSCO28_02280 [Desulfosarcina ovata subsp. sediminis]|uniref:Uncharacterized protein n=1 Tax=Desulfosarcina ovata subsp. sediminis TaxID=885957 RepID=A0A5K7ZCF1_9BACT|nr:hypothetical protein [Desulfosarcina ovata]BBO79662.1 hypothetical protein DSCO28_02280 [Desulfosarcina ovata subsp. sediminis]
MSNSKIESQIKSVDPDNMTAVEDLATKIKALARQAPATIVEMWLSEDRTASKRGRELIAEIEELAIRPALDHFSKANGEMQVRLMHIAVEQQLEMRRAIVVRLRPMLEDQSMLPVSKAALIDPDEELPVPLRTCDEAYLLLCRLLTVDQDELETEQNEEAFLELSVEKRNARIKKAISSKSWSIWSRSE